MASVRFRVRVKVGDKIRVRLGFMWGFMVGEGLG